MWLQSESCSRADAGGRGFGVESGRHISFQRPRRPGRGSLRERDRTKTYGQKTDLRHLSGAPDHGVSVGRQEL